MTSIIIKPSPSVKVYFPIFVSRPATFAFGFSYFYLSYRFGIRHWRIFLPLIALGVSSFSLCMALDCAKEITLHDVSRAFAPLLIIIGPSFIFSLILHFIFVIKSGCSIGKMAARAVMLSGLLVACIISFLHGVFARGPSPEMDALYIVVFFSMALMFCVIYFYVSFRLNIFPPYWRISLPFLIITVMTFLSFMIRLPMLILT